MAIDTPTRSGYIIDEVYSVTAWIRRGADALRHELDNELVGADGAGSAVQEESAREPGPLALLRLVLERGSPIDEVKHLL